MCIMEETHWSKTALASKSTCRKHSKMYSFGYMSTAYLLCVVCIIRSQCTCMCTIIHTRICECQITQQRCLHVPVHIYSSAKSQLNKHSRATRERLASAT